MLTFVMTIGSIEPIDHLFTISDFFLCYSVFTSLGFSSFHIFVCKDFIWHPFSAELIHSILWDVLEDLSVSRVVGEKTATKMLIIKFTRQMYMLRHQP